MQRSRWSASVARSTSQRYSSTTIWSSQTMVMLKKRSMVHRASCNWMKMNTLRFPITNGNSTNPAMNRYLTWMASELRMTCITNHSSSINILNAKSAGNRIHSSLMQEHAAQDQLADQPLSSSTISTPSHSWLWPDNPRRLTTLSNQSCWISSRNTKMRSQSSTGINLKFHIWKDSFKNSRK